jgi:hypothetical protein
VALPGGFFLGAETALCCELQRKTDVLHWLTHFFAVGAALCSGSQSAMRLLRTVHAGRRSTQRYESRYGLISVPSQASMADSLNPQARAGRHRRYRPGSSFHPGLHFSSSFAAGGRDIPPLPAQENMMANNHVVSRPRRSAAGVAAASAPKTTRPDAPSRREEAAPASVEHQLRRTLDAFPDKIDLEDWQYQPSLRALPDELINCQLVPAILDQKAEGACTGFALAAVVNFLLAQRGIERTVSPRMLYELARRYDEWPGENYAGSSARGAMKAWERHGVCSNAQWPDGMHGAHHLDQARADQAMKTPGGAYYRVDFRQVRHVHAALNEVGIVYATLMVHAGWGEPGAQSVSVTTGHGSRARKMVLPVIRRQGSADGMHAVALIGYTAQGFIVQNSWGPGWGHKGFALLPYEDFMMHATDVWVAQLGVPVLADLWDRGAADVTSGRFRAGQAVPLNEIRPYVIDVGNNGDLSDRGDYWTTEDDLSRLFMDTIPKRTAGWSKRRVMLFIHGGLNGERDVAKRIVAYRDVCLKNEIYPLHIMWESDWLTATRDIIEDQFTAADERAGGAFLDHLREARDRVLELTLAFPGGKLWGEMKENARLASERSTGAMRLVMKYAAQAREVLVRKGEVDWELHVVAHSAGAIFAAHAIAPLAGIQMNWRSLQLMAPAIRIDRFKDSIAAQVAKGACPRPTLYILSRVGELDDDVGPYGKSLLYLISNALEGSRAVPLLGMQACLEQDAAIHELLSQPVDGLPGIVVAGEDGPVGAICRSDTHGGFDNDPNTMNSVLRRILGAAPAFPFTQRDLQF